MATYRLDGPTGRRITLLRLTDEGYARVSTIGSGRMPAFVFETLAARLWRVLIPTPTHSLLS